MNAKLKGTICGVVAAICYGTNPLGALSLYADGKNAESVLFYRYALATLLLGLLMLVERKPFGVTRKEMGIISVLGVLFASSSQCLYFSFNHFTSFYKTAPQIFDTVYLCSLSRNQILLFYNIALQTVDFF